MRGERFIHWAMEPYINFSLNSFFMRPMPPPSRVLANLELKGRRLGTVSDSMPVFRPQFYYHPTDHHEIWQTYREQLGPSSRKISAEYSNLAVLCQMHSGHCQMFRVDTVYSAQLVTACRFFDHNFIMTQPIIMKFGRLTETS